MPKGRETTKARVVNDSDDDGGRAPIPVVDYCEMPRIRIYDARDDNSYWFRRPGFVGGGIADD